MSTEITENTIGMWCVDLGQRGNILAHMARQADGSILIVVRFRWYRDNLMGRDSKDHRSWYEIRTKDAERLAIEKMRRSFDDWRATPIAEGGWELLKGARTLEEFGEVLLTMPGMHGTVEENPQSPTGDDSDQQRQTSKRRHQVDPAGSDHAARSGPAQGARRGRRP